MSEGGIFSFQRNRPSLTTRALVADFFPGYFAFVMATGIVSIALRAVGIFYLLSNLLFGLNIFSFFVLWVITILRLGLYRASFVQDLTHNGRGVTFLSTVAGTCVLGTQIAIMTPFLTTAAMLWAFAGLVWLVLIYLFFASITVAQQKPAWATTINGSWLLVTVSIESLAVLGTYVATGKYLKFILFSSVCAYSLGAMFYILFITLILYRWMFAEIRPAGFGPNEWIDMGAAAITTLAGARLLMLDNRWSFLGELSPFIRGFTLVFWVTGTWWIPLLIILGIWRHRETRVVIAYSPEYWTLVSPRDVYGCHRCLGQGDRPRDVGHRSSNHALRRFVCVGSDVRWHVASNSQVVDPTWVSLRTVSFSRALCLTRALFDRRLVAQFPFEPCGVRHT
jgi:tellurite resistance protein TehA-like permease